MNQQEIIKKVNNRFDKQIEKDRIYEIDKCLFNLTKDFTIEDWRFIRTPSYWEIHDSILRYKYPWEELPNQFKCKEFILSQVEQYIRNYK